MFVTFGNNVFFPSGEHEKGRSEDVGIKSNGVLFLRDFWRTEQKRDIYLGEFVFGEGEEFFRDVIYIQVVLFVGEEGVGEQDFAFADAEHVECFVPDGERRFNTEVREKS
jgi:hypothetical protein